MIIHHNHCSVRKCDVTGTDPRSTIQGAHHLRHISHKPKFVGKLRFLCIRAFLCQKLGCYYAFHRRIRSFDRTLRIGLRIIQDFFGIISEHGYCTCQILEQVIRNHGFHLRIGTKAVLNNSIHCLPGSRNNRLFLLVVGICHQSIDISYLIDDHRCVCCYHENNCNQHQIKNLLLNTPENNISDFFHEFSCKILEMCRRCLLNCKSSITPPGIHLSAQTLS